MNYFPLLFIVFKYVWQRPEGGRIHDYLPFLLLAILELVIMLERLFQSFAAGIILNVDTGVLVTL